MVPQAVPEGVMIWIFSVATVLVFAGFIPSLYYLPGLVWAPSFLGFLMFNFPPARLFMGDVGSAPLGYLAGGLTLWGTRDNIFPIWAPLLLFAPFIDCSRRRSYGIKLSVHQHCTCN